VAVVPTIYQACKNNDSYLYMGSIGNRNLHDDHGDDKDCKWIRYKEDRRLAYCNVDEVVDNCPLSCGECCEDRLDYTFRVNGTSESCDWLSTVTEDVAEDYCGKWRNGRMIRDGCPKSCNYCVDVSTRAPTASPTASPTIAPSPIPFTLTSQDCKNDDTYRYTGTNDLARHPHDVSCKWIRNMEERRSQYCQLNEVVEACPISCGVCCEDDNSYNFMVDGSTRDCNWISTGTGSSQDSCDTYKNGRMVRDACPKSCGFCFDV